MIIDENTTFVELVNDIGLDNAFVHYLNLDKFNRVRFYAPERLSCNTNYIRGIIQAWESTLSAFKSLNVTEYPYSKIREFNDIIRDTFEMHDTIPTLSYTQKLTEVSDTLKDILGDIRENPNFSAKTKLTVQQLDNICTSLSLLRQSVCRHYACDKDYKGRYVLD